VGVGSTGQPLLVHGSVVPVVGGPGVVVIVLTRTKRSGQEPGVTNEPHTFVSSGTRLLALRPKATTLPSAGLAGIALRSCACARASKAWFAAPMRRPSASLAKPTRRPSAERTGLKLRPLPCAPEELTLTRCVFAVHPATDTPFVRQRSRTKTSVWSFVSPGTRLVASLEKATKRPSAETAGAKNPAKLSSFACAPVE